MAENFNPFASGSAVAVAEPPRASGGFDPFASGGAVEAVETGLGPSKLGENWHNLYGGLDDLDSRLDGAQRATFSALDRVSPDAKEMRARAINQTFVGAKVGDARFGPLANNWRAVKSAFAKEVLKVDLKDPTDVALYSAIGARLKEEREAEVARTGEIKPWTWRDSILSPVYGAYHGVAKSEFWRSINRPFVDLPEAPRGLPDVTIAAGAPVPFNPAVVGGVWNAIKPLIEGVESPLGVATLGAGPQLHALAKTQPLAKAAAAGISGLFAALMGKAAVDGAAEIKPVFDDPASTTQDKVTALASPVATAAASVLGVLGTAFELLPDKGAAAGKRLAGKTPTRAAEILRQEAVSASPEAGDALNRAATTLDDVGAHERGPDAWEAKPPTGERIAAAAVRLPDGTVVEGASHEQIHAEVAPDPTESLPPAARAIVAKAEEVGLRADVTDSGGSAPTPLRAALEKFEGTGEIETVRDLADRVEEMIASGEAPESLGGALEEYRAELREDFEQNAGRGDVESAENKFVDAVRAASGPEPKGGAKPATPPAAPASVDLSAVRGAKTREEMTTAAGRLIMAAKTREEIAAVQAAMKEWRPPSSDEGFVTTSGRFVSREEARAIAEGADQIKAPEDPSAKPAAGPLKATEVDLDPTPDLDRSSFGQTSLKNAYGELERVAYGFEEAPSSERRSMAERWARSGEILADNPEAGRILADRLLKNPNLGLTDDQSALLLRHKVGLQNALNEAADAAADPLSSPELKEEAGRQVKELSDQLLQLLDAVNKRGSEWGREGRWRQAIAREDYSFAAQETLLRAAKGGADLSDAERAALSARVKQLEKAQADYEAKIADLTATTREVAAERAVRELSRPPAAPRKFKAAEAVREKLKAKADESRRFLSGKLFTVSPEVLYHMSVIGAEQIYSTGLDFAEWSAAMIKDLGEKARPALKDAWEASKKLFLSENSKGLVANLGALDPESRAKALGPTAVELARNAIADGVRGRDAVVDRVHEQIKGAIPEASRREVMDAISGYGQFKPLSHDEITDRLRDVKGQLQQVAKLEDMAAGEAPKKTGVERRIPSDEERALAKSVEAKKREGGYVVTDPEKQIRTALQAAETRLTNEISDVERQLRTNEVFDSPTKPAPTSAKIEALKARLAELREARDYARGALQPEADVLDLAGKRAAELDRRIKEVEKQLKSGEVFPKAKGARPPVESAEVQAREARLAELKLERDSIRESLQPKPEPLSPEERAIRTVKGNLDRQIKLLEEQIAKRAKAPKPKRTPASDAEVERLKARRDELKAEFEMIFGRPELTEEQRLNIWKASAKRRVAELEQRLADKDFDPRPKRPPPALDDEAVRLKTRLERIKQDFAIERIRAEEARRPGWQKALRTTADLARASALSGYHTLVKLATYSLARFAEKPVVEAVGSVLRRIPGVKAVAAKANLEAGAEYAGLAKFYAKAATRGMSDALETLKTGKSSLKAELADPRSNAEVVRWYDYFGLSHMAEKSPLLRGEFELRLEKSHQWAIANGLDVTDPLVAGALRKDAFDYSMHEILQEDNQFADGLNAFTARLEAANPKTGKVDLTKAALSTFVKTFLTKGIVKTPSNYIMQTLKRSPLGLAKGTAQTFVAHVGGVDKLTPEEANAIMRLLKLGAVGTAVFTWGVIDATKDPKDRIFGGYYQPGDKRSPDDVGFGRIRVDGREFPHLLTHNPLTEAGQMGSTFYRVMKSRLGKKGSKDEKGVVAGAAASLVALASEAPIVSPITQTAAKVERGEVDKIVNEEIASLIPMLIQNLAQDLDGGKSRKAETLGQAVEKAIPGLRGNVPETKAQKERDIRERIKK